MIPSSKSSRQHFTFSYVRSFAPFTCAASTDANEPLPVSPSSQPLHSWCMGKVGEQAGDKQGSLGCSKALPSFPFTFTVPSNNNKLIYVMSSEKAKENSRHKRYQYFLECTPWTHCDSAKLPVYHSPQCNTALYFCWEADARRKTLINELAARASSFQLFCKIDFKLRVLKHRAFYPATDTSSVATEDKTNLNPNRHITTEKLGTMVVRCMSDWMAFNRNVKKQIQEGEKSISLSSISK